MHVIARSDQLNEVESSFWFGVTTTFSEEIEE